MHTDTHHAAEAAGTYATTTPPSSRVTRAILGSLATGLATAALLTLVVFAGATEAVITGSVLLAFGLGWAMMAVLTRRSSEPQRWAIVPAVAMSATGAALLAFRPQDAVLSTLNWLWPPAMLVLVAWMLIQIRRAHTRRRRWLLMPVLVVLAVASIGALVQDLTGARSNEAYPAPGQTYSVGDHRLHLDCRGTGGPTVVLFNGLGETSASWTRITRGIGTTTRVCAYDRAGQGWSDDAATPQDGVTAAGDLQSLLAVAGEHGPYVLVGHSTGGPYAMTYAATYPEQVAGMVLLDSSSPRQLTDIPSYPLQYAVMRRGLAIMPMLTRLGLGSLITPASQLPAEDADRVQAIASTPRAARNGRDEIAMAPVVFEQAQALSTLGDRPLAVLTASETLATVGWDAAQDRIAGLSTDSVHREVESTHAGLVEDPDPSAESVRTITAVVHAVRSHSLVANP